MGYKINDQKESLVDKIKDYALHKVSNLSNYLKKLNEPCYIDRYGDGCVGCKHCKGYYGFDEKNPECYHCLD